MNVVSIPYVPREERIGSVFNELFCVINETESCRGTEIVWDFKYCSFFHPFFIAALAIYRDNFEGVISLDNIEPRLHSYLNLIKFEGLLNIIGEDDVRVQLQPYIDRSYTPICKFEMSKVNVDGVQSVIQHLIQRQAKIDNSIISPLSYMIGELVDNINEHALSDYGYMFSQYLPSERCINICIADAGITVFGSYLRRNKFIAEIGYSEAKALQMANVGFSTKDRPENESRGFGISTTKKILVKGLNGAFFMLSGHAYHRYDNSSDPVYVEIPKPLNWDGTIILLKIPVEAPAGFNYENYLM